MAGATGCPFPGLRPGPAHPGTSDRRRPVRKPRPPAAAPTKGKKESTLPEPININTATLAELQKLPGIGPKLSQRIVDERTLRGPFKTVEELRRVAGIGVKTMDRLRP